MQHPEAQPPLHVRAALFRQIKTRIEKVRRIAADLKSGDHQRIKELRDIEATSMQRPDLHRPLNPRKEDFIETRDNWHERRLRLTYVSPQGEEIEEDIVNFAYSGRKGSVLWLLTPKPDGTHVIPVDLFDAKLLSRLHGIPIGSEIRMIPRVDGRGAYLGVYSVAIFAR